MMLNERTYFSDELGLTKDPWADGRGARMENATLESLSDSKVVRCYMAGVLHGDGWINDQCIGLRVKDRDFAEEFAKCVAYLSGRGVNITPDGPYHVVRSGNGTGAFNGLYNQPCRTNRERSAWLCGYFDSDGSAQCGPAKQSKRSTNRRVAFYSTCSLTLFKCEVLLESLGFQFLLREMKRSKTHYGDKPVYELRLRSSEEQYRRFAEIVSSSIRRKREKMDAIIQSYADSQGHHSRGGKAGCPSRWGNAK